MKLSTADKQFHRRLRAKREAKGLTIDDTIIEIRQMLPEPMWIGRSTLSRLETETPEAKADPFVVSVLAAIYGVPTSDISEVAATGLGRLRDLVEYQLSWTGSVTQMPQREYIQAS